MVYLAGRPEKACGTREIAAATQVPPSYVSKILLSLVKKHFIQSQRGLHGGFMLSCDAHQVTVFDVINAIDPVARIRECPLHRTEHEKSLCPLHTRLDDAFSELERSFRNSPLVALLSGGLSSGLPCPGAALAAAQPAAAAPVEASAQAVPPGSA
jgi:Rrf2 family protein